MRQHLKFWPALIILSPALITHFSGNAFHNILAANVTNIIGRNPPFYSFASFLILWLIRYINNPDSSSNWTIFIISSISSFEVINAILPDPYIFFWIATSTAEIPADNPNGIRRL